MYEHTLPIQFISEEPVAQSKPIDISNLLVKEYRFWNVWLDRQTETERMKIINQADNLANALLQGKKAAIITYPGELIFPVYGSATNDTKEWVISEAGKNIVVQRKHRWFASENFLQTIEKQFSCLEGSADQGIAAFGGLLRFATSHALIYDRVPAGKEVIYSMISGEDIPSIPQTWQEDNPQANGSEAGYASRFYLPQWVAFDENGQLLVENIEAAEFCIASLQNYLGILRWAVMLAPYMVVDSVYRQKYYGILGQFVNQSRAICNYWTNEIIATIRRRSGSNRLNRGLSLTIPYFDDQAVVLRKLEFGIIPPGRVMFVPAFLIMAVQEQITMVRHNTTLNFSTRKHLLDQLERIVKSFEGEMN